MMQIQFQFIIKVIFVLSTIVAVTDCCSSRILLLREHTLKIVEHQHNFHNHMHEHAHQLQQQIEHHVVQLVNQMEFQQQLDVQQVETDAAASDESLLFYWKDLGESAVDEAATTTTETNQPTTTIDSLPPAGEQLSSSTVMPSPTGEPPPQNGEDHDVDNIETFSSSSTETSASSSLPSTTPSSSPAKPKVQDDFNIVRAVHTCSGSYKTDYCLNGGRCFRFPLTNHSIIPSCECADGYVGERCEFKSLNGEELYVSPAQEVQPKILMARIVFSFPMLILLSTIYVAFGTIFLLRGVPKQRREQQQQQLRLHKQRIFVTC